MSDRTVYGHTLACDWPGCGALADCGGYSCWESYDTAVYMFAEEYSPCSWYHDGDGHDYCPRHWHVDDDDGEVVFGPWDGD